MARHLGQFERLVTDPKDIGRVNRTRVPQLRVLWPFLIILAALGFLWWRREIGSRRQREKLRIIYHLGEEILSATSTPEILNKVELARPKVLPLTGPTPDLDHRGP